MICTYMKWMSTGHINYNSIISYHMVMCSDLAGMQAIIPPFSCHRNKKETPSRAKKLLALLTLVYLLQLHERIPSCSSIQIMSLAILLSRPSVAGQSSRDLGDYMVLVQDHMRSGSSPCFFQDSKSSCLDGRRR